MGHKDISIFFKSPPPPQESEKTEQRNIEHQPSVEPLPPHSQPQIIESIVKTIIDHHMDAFKSQIRTIVLDILENDSRFKGTVAKRASKKQAHPLSRFGMEDYKYMLNPYLTNTLNSVKNMNTVLQKIICDLYFNPDQKQNHIVFIAPNSCKCISVYKEPGGWGNFELEPTLQQIIRRANDILQHYIVGVSETEERQFKDALGEDCYNKLVEFTDQIDNMESHPEFQKRLLKETEHTIVTKQHLVHKGIYDPISPS